MHYWYNLLLPFLTLGLLASYLQKRKHNAVSCSNITLIWPCECLEVSFFVSVPANSGLLLETLMCDGLTPDFPRRERSNCFPMWPIPSIPTQRSPSPPDALFALWLLIKHLKCKRAPVRTASSSAVKHEESSGRVIPVWPTGEVPQCPHEFAQENCVRAPAKCQPGRARTQVK